MNFNEVRSQIYRYLASLETMIFTLEELYANAETVTLMNQRAGAFFQQHQTLLVDKIFLELAKLFDPAELGKNKNLSLKLLMSLTPPSVMDSQKLNHQLNVAETAVGKMKAVRNKSICHNDFDPNSAGLTAKMDEIKNSLKEAKTLFQICCGTEYHSFSPDISPARSLQQWLSPET